jgi:DNA-binding CsgD family transcriptional regulator
LISKNQLKEILAEPEDEYQLSKSEMDILRLLVDGLDYKVVANQLFISPHTVRKHIANIYEKKYMLAAKVMR